ncbi:MAG: type II toxin-antitoxin system VapC family toxin [Spirochaetaceae bacterium]|nr:type II toxin-antitoxin system VapC family toxin [Spirochaetaceae bacterium]MDE0228467.1 type II toxin-antitoxin system VapC family toxin [Spirochaetaceae bacterium]
MPITHLLDTSVYSQPIRKAPLRSVQRRWAAVGDRSLSTSVICEAEVLQGLEAKGSDRLWRAYRSVLKGRVNVLPVDVRVAEHYARVQAAAARIGRTRPAFDLLIAATALVHGLILATCNARHFAGIEGLPVEDWSRDN